MRDRNVKVIPSKGEKNSLIYWPEEVGFWKVFRNIMILKVARLHPSDKAKAKYWRRTGAKIGENVAFGFEVTLDFLYPELITIGDDTILGFQSVIATHEFVQREWHLGPTTIGKRCMIGARSLILPGVTVADDSVVAAGSIVTHNVEGFVGGIPARPLKRKE